MARPRGAVGVFLCILLGLALTLFPAPATAHHQGTVKAVDVSISETVPLPVNNWTAYTFSLNLGDEIKYEIHVTNGTAIDVYFVPPDGLQAYANDTALQFRLFLDIVNLRDFSGHFGGQTGSVSVIVDNTDVTQGGATLTGPVTVSVHLEKSSSLFLSGVILILCGIAFLAVAIAMVFILRRRRKAAEGPPPPVPYSGPPPSTHEAPPAPSPPESPAEGPPPPGTG
ncbi:MAG: hypothetical protein E6K10_00455 [Methanobacteriota archaeon]|nr:MAG: hypothetical protein E6K10_00455 [Euryarchaeota archaeon]